MQGNKLKQLYFSHDIFADKDEKIVKMFFYYKKNKFSDDFIRRNFFHAAFGLFWEIVQYMYRNELMVDDIPALADELRADEDFVRSVIMDFGLFRIEGEKVISDRILRNIQKINVTSEKQKNKAQARWLLSSFAKYYEEFFNEKPVLNSDEIEVLKKYSVQIPEFKDKLRDILYTLKGLKFKDLPDFKPKANWLLKGNNLARLLNGEFGGLKHFKTQEEIEADNAASKEESRISGIERDELKSKINEVKDKDAALNLIKEFYKGKTAAVIRNKAVLLPDFKVLTEKFRISDAEILKLLNKAPP